MIMQIHIWYVSFDIEKYLSVIETIHYPKYTYNPMFGYAPRYAYYVIKCLFRISDDNSLRILI